MDKSRPILEVMEQLQEVRAIALRQKRPFTSVLSEVLRTGVEAERHLESDFEYHRDYGWIEL